MSAGRRAYLLAGIGLLAVVNGVVLAGVYANRQMPADSVIKLSERELNVFFGRYGGEASNAVSLGLKYRWPSRGEAENFIPASKMQELGFETNLEPADCRVTRTVKHSARDAFLVIEVNGPAYQRELDVARKAHVLAAQRLKAHPGHQSRKSAFELAENGFNYERNQASRALVVDIGLDREALRVRYPDRNQYALVAASFQPRTRTLDGVNGGASLCVSYATAAQVVRRIHVPREFQGVFVREASLKEYGRYGRGADLKPLTVELAFGKRLEPWLLGAQLIQP